MKDELDDPTPREESGSLESGLFAGADAEDNSFEARRPGTRNDEEGSIENRTEISEAVVDEEDEDEEADEEEDDEDEDEVGAETEVDGLASDEENEDDDDDDDDDDEEEAE